jgi:hypothetical protein
VVADRELPAHAVDCVFGTDHQEHLVEVVAFSYSLDGAPYTDPLGRSAAGHGGTYTDTFQSPLAPKARPPSALRSRETRLHEVESLTG